MRHVFEYFKCGGGCYSCNYSTDFSSPSFSSPPIDSFIYSRIESDRVWQALCPNCHAVKTHSEDRWVSKESFVNVVVAATVSGMYWCWWWFGRVQRFYYLSSGKKVWSIKKRMKDIITLHLLSRLWLSMIFFLESIYAIVYNYWNTRTNLVSLSLQVDRSLNNKNIIKSVYTSLFVNIW